MSYTGTKSGGSSSSTIMVDSSNVGKIIGRGGSRIRDLEQSSNTRIKISRDENEEGMKTVEINGTDEEIENARRMIEECLTGGDVGGSNGSSGGRRGGFQSRGRGGSSGGYGRRDDNWGGRRDRDSGDGWGRRDDYDRGSRGSGRSGGGGGGGFGGSSSGGGSGGEAETIYIESSEVGRIIGRGGSRIRDMEAESGCRIKVSRDGDSSGHSSVELSGSKNAISEAKRLIQDAGVEIVNGSDRGRGSFGSDNLVLGTLNEVTAVSMTTTTETEGPDEWGFVKAPPINWNKIRESYDNYLKTRFDGLTTVIKSFYTESPSVANMTNKEVQCFRKENYDIKVETPPDGGIVPNPIRTFSDAFELYADIMVEINKQKFIKPSPIQSQAWPILLQGKDLIGIAQTGTGKTFAFLFPALIHIDNQTTPRNLRTGPSALILAPTRELALQIEKEIHKVNYKGIRSVCAYGGADRNEQIDKIKKGVEIVVGTPGRLRELIQCGYIDVSHVTYLVMDEADKMLDLGFDYDVKKIVEDIRPDRQTVMTSATWPEGVQRLANQYMTNAYRIFVGSLDLAAVHSVRQIVEIVDETDKIDLLVQFCHERTNEDKVIIFCGKKATADHVASDIARKHIDYDIIHGNIEQSDREKALEDFKDGRTLVLVATDVASRGLDVKDVTHVVNYDFPHHIEEYVHRVGRTGRAGRTGTALTYFTRNDWKFAQQLINILSEAGQEVPDELVSMAARFAASQRRRQENYPNRRFHKKDQEDFVY